jgi:hypothetical protein
MTVVQILLAVLVYPGIVLALALGILFALLRTGQSWRHVLALFRVGTTRTPWHSQEWALHLLSVGLAGCGLALLPWPWHPIPPDPAIWLWSWSALEAAFLLPLLPALLAGSPPVVRAAIRAAQIGVTGRTVLWLGLTVGLALHDSAGWQLVNESGHSPLLAHGLALLVAIFALPVAVEWGPFAPETSITPDAAEQGLDAETVRLAGVTAHVRTAALLAASLVALLPTGALHPLAGLALVLAAFAGIAALQAWQAGRHPRLTLPVALHKCLWRTLPIGAAAILYLALLS